MIEALDSDPNPALAPRRTAPIIKWCVRVKP
jgi:hypothetical protein